MAPRTGRRAQTVPRRATVSADGADVALPLEHLEGGAQSDSKLGRSDRVELLLRVVHVVHVDRVDAKVGAAACDLRIEERRRDAVCAADDVLGAGETGRNELALDVCLIFLACRRR